MSKALETLGEKLFSFLLKKKVAFSTTIRHTVIVN